MLIAGRYEGSGDITAVLTGQSASGAQRFEYELSLPEASDDPGIALLWAQRRIADLLRELRIEGAREGLIESIVGIANQFGIVTPYTSYLAEEPDAVFEAEEAMEAMADDMADEDSFGEAAVRTSESLAETRRGRGRALDALGRAPRRHAHLLPDRRDLDRGGLRPHRSRARRGDARRGEARGTPGQRPAARGRLGARSARDPPSAPPAG